MRFFDGFSFDRGKPCAQVERTAVTPAQLFRASVFDCVNFSH
jgi:hypothetical protein